MAKNKKKKILEVAAQLFASQGFDNTTTLQIARETRVTEPLLYYHFKGKEEIFTYILAEVFQKYAEHIDELPKNTQTEFDKIANLIRLHSHIAEEHPQNARLILSNCPGKLMQKQHACRDILEKQQQMVSSYIQDCLESGNAKKEFDAHPVEQTALILLCLANEFMRMKIMRKKDSQPDTQGTIEFCRKSLVKS
ncbi:transcriptional regulator, TetR family [Desulfonatronospira thiodismutans ASO3-1]|uniref:Transcriptional regulator, TetR family n=1 Tax=Desulfonatronospira thiodismutans ASO3-1 TaxID=555779 RepID=D6SRG5_9BACT|nr:MULTISPECIES: TetR/AcrR family transcriptional regulator [Desulfonatronospira]EFI33281.1 transcriptional regulator, TetR family [Desulfonatronospira thiodismutans ASO3-1]RQD74841.1 MAG: TetR/AcrR family transcriptional regulator [Desulfonatronospira sp. MSAO_Bac3]